MILPSRTSPRLLAKQKVAGSATSSGIDVGVSSPVTDPAVVAEVDIVDASLAGAHSIADNPIVGAPAVASIPVDTVSNSVVPASNTASTTANVESDMPFLDTDQGVTSHIPKVRVDATHASSFLAGSSVGVEARSHSDDPVPHVPLHDGSITCPLGTAVPILSDAVCTSVSKTVDTILDHVHVPAGEATPAGVTALSDVHAPVGPSATTTLPGAVNNTASSKKLPGDAELHDMLQKKIDEVAAKNGGFYPASMLFLEWGAPDATLESPPHAPPEDEPAENDGFVAGSAPGSSGSAQFPEASATLPTHAPCVAGSTIPIVNEHEEEDVLPLSFALPTSAGKFCNIFYNHKNVHDVLYV